MGGGCPPRRARRRPGDRHARRAEVERLRQHVDAGLDEVTPGGITPREATPRAPPAVEATLHESPTGGVTPGDSTSDESTPRAPREARSRAVKPDGDERGFYSVRDVTSFEVMSTVRDALELREKGDGPLSCRGTHSFLGYTVSRTERLVARRTVRRMRGRLKAAVRAGGAVTDADRRRIATELPALLRGLVL